ncbi:MAG: DNA-processing protein DprA [Pseudomonadota bacterium]
MQDTDPATPASRAASLAAWLRLVGTDGVGLERGHGLLEAFKTPASIFSASHAELCAHVPGAVARALLSPPAGALRQQIDATLAWLAEPAHALLPVTDAAYPALLRETAHAPLLLYVNGRRELLDAPALALVGSRNASAQGQANARAFARALSAAGLTIVSGMALGIDAAAHEGGLDGVGSTVAVIGTGIDRIYPKRNEALARRIAEHGCIVSEYPLGTAPSAGNFPKRNRIISGLCAGVLVVEAAAGSGSLITAHQACDQGREVFAIPGSIHAALAKGCHKLIKEGAQLVECADDVLFALGHSPLLAAPGAAGTAARAAAPVPAREHALLAALGFDPVDADTLAARLGSAPGALAGQLLALELAGGVERLPGGLFQRVAR